MVKKIGNFLYFLMSLVAMAQAVDNQSLRIQINDLQNNKVSQVEVGVPFLVQVTAQNIESKDQPQGFDAWDDFAVTLYGQNHATTSVNGDVTRSTTFTYIVTPQQKGSFVCPALLITDKQGNVIKSQDVKIIVGDTVQISQQTNSQPFVLQIDVDERTVFVGQKITMLLRFGYQDPFQDLRITETPMQNIHRGFVAQEAKAGKFKIGQQEYTSQDFLMELYPEKIGTLVIPTFQASFSPQRQQNMHSLFSMVLGGGNVIQSQPRSLEVKVLPEHEEFKNVTAIGQFDSVEFQLSANQGSVGEGLVAKMIVIGDGNLEVVKAPSLNMPEGLHYYEGNSNVVREKNGTFKKEFEWIVQAEHADTFEIPAQKFVYFNLKHQEYRFLKSQPHKITIRGVAKKITEQQSATNVVAAQLVEKNETKKDIKKSSSVHQSWFDFSIFSSSQTSKMLTFVIEMLFGVLAIFCIILFSRRYGKDLFFVETLKIRLQFLACCKKKDIYGVYRLFEMILQKYGLGMQGSELQQCFIDLKMSDESFENWKNFVTMIWEMNFAKERASDQSELAFSLAKQWFVIILSCCKLQKKKQATAKIL